MENIETFIQGSEKLTNFFGYWPDFHDAEVLELHFSRGRINSDKGQFDLPALTINIDLKEWANPAGPSGDTVFRRRVFTTLRFGDVDNFRMEGFNHQNVILGLYIDRLERPQCSSSYFRVHFDPAFGMGSIFECRHIEVVNVSSRDEYGTPVV